MHYVFRALLLPVIMTITLAALNAQSTSALPRYPRPLPQDRTVQQTVVLRDTLLSLDRNGIVEISAGASDLLITGRSAAGVRIVGAGSQSPVIVSGSASALTIRSDRNDRRGRLEIEVPRGARVVARTLSGNVVARNIEGAVELLVQAGNVELSGIGGDIDLTMMAGSGTISDARGAVRVNVVSGTLNLEGVRGSEVAIDGVNGSISLSDVAATAMRVKTMNGVISCSSAIPTNAVWSLESFAGGVRMRVPSSARALFTVESFAGEFRSDVPMTLLSSSGGGRGPGGRRELRLGAAAPGGGARVTIKSFSGGVTIQDLPSR